MTEYPEYNPLDSMEDLPLNEPNEIELLKYELNRAKQRIDYKIFQLQRLAQFESDFVTHGSLTYEQTLEKNEILNQYAK